MLDRRYDLTLCRAIGVTLGGDGALRQASLLLHQQDQQAFTTLGVAEGLDDLIEHVTS